MQHIEPREPFSLKQQAEDALPSVSVIIVNYETSKFVRRCVESLTCQNIPIEIIVVDNASPSDDWRNLEGLPVRIVRNAENMGYGLGCNVGAQYAHAPMLCILNPDTIVPPDMMEAWLNSFAKLRESGVRIGVLAPALYNENGTLQRSTYKFPGPLTYWLYHSLLSGLLKKLRKAYGFPSLYKPHLKPRTVDWVMGSAMLIPKKAWDEIEGFSPSYFLYAEDTDLCFRLKNAGYEIIQDPRISIIHSQGEPSLENRALAITRFFRGLDTFLELHCPRWRRVGVRYSILMDLALRMTLLSVGSVLFSACHSQNRERMRAYRQIFAQFWKKLLR